jgi:hypothetical protein
VFAVAAEDTANAIVHRTKSHDVGRPNRRVRLKLSHFLRLARRTVSQTKQGDGTD